MRKIFYIVSSLILLPLMVESCTITATAIRGNHNSLNTVAKTSIDSLDFKKTESLNAFDKKKSTERDKEKDFIK